MTDAAITPSVRPTSRDSDMPHFESLQLFGVKLTFTGRLAQRLAAHVKWTIVGRHLALFALSASTTLCPSAYAGGALCTRMLPDGLGPTVCAPMAFFTRAVWGLNSYATYPTVPLASWHVYDTYYPDPWPAFDSPEAFVQAYVAANPAATACGATPYVAQGFTYGSSRLRSNVENFGTTDLLDWTDQLSFSCRSWPPPNPFGCTIEEASILYKWIVPSTDIPPRCDSTVTISAVRRRIAACPNGYVPNTFGIDNAAQSSEVLQDPQICIKSFPFDPKNLGSCTGPNQTAGNPVNVATGNKYEAETDIPPSPLGTLGFQRHYNSAQFGSWELGAQWRHTYKRSIQGWSARVFAARPDGKVFQFSKLGPQWTPDSDVSDRLTQLFDANNNQAGWRYVTATDEIEIYDASGRLQSITARNGVSQTLTYSTVATPTAPAAGLLVRVTDSFSRRLDFTYDAMARIVQIADPLGRVYQYAYDATGNLSTIVYPDGAQRRYLYNEPQYTQNSNLPWILTGIVDENAGRYATFSYDATGRGVATEHAGGVDKHQFDFGVYGTSTIVTDPLGAQRTYNYATFQGTYKNTSMSQPCTNCGGQTASAITYDTHGNIAAIVDFRSTTTSYVYDQARNLEISRTEAASTPQQRIVQTQWDPIWRLPVQITAPAPGGTKTTTFTYDASGNLTQRSITAPKNDGTSATVTRNFTWTYISFGRTATSTDPNGNITRYAYYADNDADIGKRGNVQTITNALGQITQITSYDGAGRPLATTDANGLATTLAYDVRGRITSRQVGAEMTRYIYDGVGQLTRVTLPDGSYLQYVYDGAHRLAQASDSLGNKIVYTLDAIGNRIGESAYDPAGQLARTRARQFDALNRLASDLGAQSQTTAYTYDNNGNLLTTVDPLGHATGNVYDALNRLTQVLDPSLGVTKYAYDSANNLTQVTDSRNLPTTYKYDGLNNLVQQVSPDTGTTTNSYDSAGNLLTKTDARGVTATYTYDNVNRATRIVFSNGTTSETHTFQYDIGSNAKGHLSQVTDTSGFTNWTYNTQGRLANKSQRVDSYTYTVSYGYNSAGQLTSITTPSGQQVGYGYLNNRVTSVTLNGQSILQAAATTPFGPIAAWRWGNGLYTFRDYDRDGRLATWEFRNGSSILRKDQSFDAASRIIGITDPIHPVSNQTYQYDALDRLTGAQTGVPPVHTQQFSYDSVGNRLNVTLDSSVTNFAYGTANNRLQALSGALPANYFLGSGSWSLTYNNANRLSAVQSGATNIATYRVNALGQRVSKNAGGSITYFVYDEQGRLLGEYNNAGNLIEETVWIEDLPVATLRPTGATGTPTPINAYYVHTDHLGSPRVVTRPSDNALMWQWDNIDPFGANPANENPANQGNFTYNLRFPGQYYDAQTGTNYNAARDYDLTIGRYAQSDPIGIWGGLNTYGYAGAGPTDRADPTGLAWVCTAPLHVAPGLDFGGHGPFHHEFVCDTPQHCGGQDWSRSPWYGNPILGPGTPSVGDRFNAGRCKEILPDNQCMNSCLAKKIDDPSRPPYSVIPHPTTPAVFQLAPMCQEWAEAIVQECHALCAGKK